MTIYHTSRESHVSVHRCESHPKLPSFPSSWPVYTPALKLADWLESYAHSMELDVWTSATVVSVIPGTQGKKWSVLVQRADGRERTFEVNHVVFALGFGSGVGRVPDIPGQVCSIHKYTVLSRSQPRI